MSQSSQMNDYLPRYYENSRQMNEIMNTEGKAVDQLLKDTTDVLNQFFIETSTWGIDKWEELMDIPTDPIKPIEQRISVVKSKLRGVGTVTESLIKNVAESYLNGEVEVAENNTSYETIVKFIGKLGVPPNVDDIEKAIREVLPVHLLVIFEFSYFLIKDIHNTMTLTELETMTLDKFAGGA